ncbi:MAG TPA: DUF190 domain-containing protein [Candidatus Angelobacter sp.]
MTEPRKAVQVSVYLNESDEWHRRPLHLEMLKYLREQEVAGATVLHAVAGFTGRGRVKTSSLVDAGGKLPLVLTFIDVEEHVNRVLPHIKEMAPHRLIVSEKVSLESGELE